MPHRAQVWNSAVRVPNAYLDTSEGSLTTTSSTPPGLEVHTPPCLVQNEQVQARTGISAGSGSQAREKEMFPQWHFPLISMRAISVLVANLVDFSAVCKAPTTWSCPRVSPCACATQSPP